MGAIAAPVVVQAATREQRARYWLKFLFWVTTVLVAGGAMASFSTTVFYRLTKSLPPYTDFLQHLMFIGLGAACALVAGYSLYRFRPVRTWATWLIPLSFLVSLVLVGMVKFSGLGVSAYGATRGLSLLGVTFQPSEMLKISVVLYLAQLLCWWRLPAPSPAERRVPGNGRSAHLARRKPAPSFRLVREARPVWPELPTRCLFAVLLAAGFTVIQPDLGSTGIILGAAVLTMLIAGVDLRKLALFFGMLALVGLLAAVVAPGYYDYAAKRITTWINPLHSEDGAAYQITQAQGALAGGGLLGRGYLQSEQKMNRLPLATKDFVYPVIVEELGYIGGVAVILAFLALAFAGLQLSLCLNDPFSRTVVCALGFTVCLQAFVNIGTTIGTLPLSGLTLPFFSEGGTSIVVSLTAIGTMAGLALGDLRQSTLRRVAQRD